MKRKNLPAEMRESEKGIEIPVRASDQLGQAVERFRRKAKLSQTELGKAAGVRQATVSKIETGIGTAEIKTIFAICAAMGLELVMRPRKSESDSSRTLEAFLR